jgi:precorrin-6B methylase 2
LPELCEPEDPADIYSELTFYDIEHDDEPDFYDDGEGWSIDGALSEEELAMLNASREDARADGSYFDSYGGVGIHREMIADETRTGAYLAAIEAHADELRGKVVLDVGCGTGILAMFAARAGARKVYAVEASGVAKHARRIVKDNGLDGVVEVIRGRMEDIGEDEIVEKVDCVLSEWMGYALLFESMLPSVIDARDRFMKPGGLVLPNVATIHVAALSDMTRYDDAVGFWDDVYGFDFSSLAARTRRDWSDDPPVSTVPRERVVSDAAEVARIDCATVRFEDLFEPTDGAFELVIEKPKKTSGGRGGTGEEEGVGQRGGEDAAEDEDAAAADADADDEDEEVMVNGLVLWFDVDFYGRASLSTSPM